MDLCRPGSQLEQLSEESKTAQQQGKGNSNEIAQLKARQRTQTGEITMKDRRISGYEQELHWLRKKVEEKETSVERTMALCVESLVRCHNEEIRRMQEVLIDEKMAVKRRKVSDESTMKQLQIELSQKERNLLLVETECRTLQTEKNLIEREREEMEVEMTMAFEKERKTWSSIQSKLESEIQNLEGEVNEYHGRLLESNQINEQLRKQIENFEIESATTKAKSKKEVAELTLAIEQCRLESMKLANQPLKVQQLKTENEELRLRIHQLEELLPNMETEKTLKDRSELLDDQIGTSGEQVNENTKFTSKLVLEGNRTSDTEKEQLASTHEKLPRSILLDQLSSLASPVKPKPETGL